MTPLATCLGLLHFSFCAIYVDGSPDPDPRPSMASRATDARSLMACHCSCCTPGGPFPRLRARCLPCPNLGRMNGRHVYVINTLNLMVPTTKEIIDPMSGTNRTNVTITNGATHKVVGNMKRVPNQSKPGSGKNWPWIS